MVSKQWTRRVPAPAVTARINRKFTPNQIRRIFREFSPH
jgi:hypothetical protein